MVKLLLIAPTVDGTDIGEAWVAYQWALRLAARHDVTLLTYRKRGRPSVAAQLPGVRVVEWLEPPLLGRAERLNSLLKPGYVAFYVRVRHWIRAAVRRGEHFDVVHQPLPVAMRYPSPVAGLGIPYVLGPVGGSLASPPGFDQDDTAPWYVRLRRFDGWRLRHDRVLRRSFADAACVLVIAPYAQEALSVIALREVVVMSETGLEALPSLVDRAPSDGEVRLLFVGRLVRTKGARDLIRAMASVRDLAVSLDIVGDGFDRAACEALVRALDLSDAVRFQGRLPRPAVDAFYRSADVFVFPSYREPGGNVVFEAMGHGLPLVVCDRGGPGAAVDDTCGIRVTPASPEALADGVAAAVRRLVEAPEVRAAMGRAARERAERIALWDRKVDSLREVYERAASGPRGAPGRTRS